MTLNFDHHCPLNSAATEAPAGSPVDQSASTQHASPMRPTFSAPLRLLASGLVLAASLSSVVLAGDDEKDSSESKLATAKLAETGELTTALTDRIYRGSGSINLLKDVSAANLERYLTSNGGLYLGIDVNEDQSGNENRDSVGLAIRQMELVVKTTAGTFSFNDFVTSTSANLRERGSSESKDFYTAFGRGGSSDSEREDAKGQLARMDDVIGIRNVDLKGTILSAELNVRFLDTETAKGKEGTYGNEGFFDFSGGFEDFALLGKKDAAVLEESNFGINAAPNDIKFAQGKGVVSGGTDVPSAPGTPAPPLLLLGAMAAVVVFKSKRHAAA